MNTCSYDNACRFAVDLFSAVLRKSDDNLKKRIDSKIYAWNDISVMKSYDSFYYLGMLRSFRIIFPDDQLKHDFLGCRLQKLYDQSFDDLHAYFESVCGSSSPEEVKI